MHTNYTADKPKQTLSQCLPVCTSVHVYYITVAMSVGNARERVSFSREIGRTEFGETSLRPGSYPSRVT